MSDEVNDVRENSKCSDSKLGEITLGRWERRDWGRCQTSNALVNRSRDPSRPGRAGCQWLSQAGLGLLGLSLGTPAGVATIARISQVLDTSTTKINTNWATTGGPGLGNLLRAPPHPPDPPQCLIPVPHQR